MRRPTARGSQRPELMLGAVRVASRRAGAAHTARLHLSSAADFRGGIRVAAFSQLDRRPGRRALHRPCVASGDDLPTCTGPLLSPEDMIRTAGSASQRSVSALPPLFHAQPARRDVVAAAMQLTILLAPSLPLAHRRLRHVLRLRFKQAERQAPFVQPCPSSCLGALGRRSEILVPLPSVGEAEREVGTSGEVKAQVALGSERRRQWIMLGGAVQQVYSSGPQSGPRTRRGP